MNDLLAIEGVELQTLRNQIDALDDAIAALLDERAKVSATIQASRLVTGRSRVDLVREREVFARYRDNLTMPGQEVPDAVLAYCRGRVA